MPRNPNLTPASRPAEDYSEAVRRVETWLAQDEPEVDSESRLCLLTHGRKVERVVVLLHGFTNGPRQFKQFGEILFASGVNVLIPRAPFHGYRDRLTDAHAGLNAAQLVAFLTEALDIAHGLGERTTVAGLSMGGVLAAWAGQFRADVDLAMSISPALGFQALPAAITPLVGRLAGVLPNFFRWWDPEKKAARVPPFHAYPRYSTRGLAALLRLSAVLQAEAGRRPPRARRVVVVTNPTDEAVDNRFAARLVARWRAAGADNVETYAFDARHGLKHDLIDPTQPEQQVELVYPILLKLIDDQ